MEKITTAQLKKLHWLLNALCIMELKKELVLSYSANRTESSKELSKSEATMLLQVLSKQEPGYKQRKAIFFLARQAGIIWGDSWADHKMNEAKLNSFLIAKGTVKKPLYSQTLEELKRTHRQFEGIVKHNQQSRDTKHAKALTNELLSELSLTVQTTGK